MVIGLNKTGQVLAVLENRECDLELATLEGQLAGLEHDLTAESLMQQDPLSGHLLVFRNRNRDKLKILYWDQDGFAILYKRFEQGTFEFPTDGKSQEEVTTGVEITICAKRNVLEAGNSGPVKQLFQMASLSCAGCSSKRLMHRCRQKNHILQR